MATKRAIDLDQFGGASAKIVPDDLQEDVAILTVATYEEMEVDDSDTGGKRRTACLRFEETGDKVLWLNKTALKTLVERLGQYPDDWAGQKVPVERVTKLFRGQKFPKVDIVPMEEWDDYLKPSRKRGKR